MIFLTEAIIADDAQYNITSEVHVTLSKVGTDQFYYENTTGREVRCSIILKFTHNKANRQPDDGTVFTLRTYIGPNATFTSPEQVQTSKLSYTIAEAGLQVNEIAEFVLPDGMFLYLTAEGTYTGGQGGVFMQAEVWDVSSNVSFAARRLAGRRARAWPQSRPRLRHVCYLDEALGIKLDGVFSFLAPRLPPRQIQLLKRTPRP